MAQITLYLDDATQALVDQAAQINKVSRSLWVSEIIRKYAAQEWPQEWPQDCLELAGSFSEALPIKKPAPSSAGFFMLALQRADSAKLLSGNAH